jgi:hypothetical protein
MLRSRLRAFGVWTAVLTVWLGFARGRPAPAKRTKTR